MTVAFPSKVGGNTGENKGVDIFPKITYCVGRFEYSKTVKLYVHNLLEYVDGVFHSQTKSQTHLELQTSENLSRPCSQSSSNSPIIDLYRPIKLSPEGSENESGESKAKWCRQMILNSAASRPSMLSKVECDTHRSVNVEDDADDEDSPSAFLTELPSGISQCLNSPRSQISTSRTVDLTDKEDVIAKDTSALTRTTKESLSSVTPESWSERKPQVVEAEEATENSDTTEDLEDLPLLKEPQTCQPFPLTIKGVMATEKQSVGVPSCKFHFRIPVSRTTVNNSVFSKRRYGRRNFRLPQCPQNSVRADFSEEIEDCRLVDLESEGLEKRTPTPKSPFLTNSSSSRIRSHSNKLVPWNQLVTPHPSVISDSSGDANRAENTRPPVRGADGASQTVGRRQRPEAGTIPPIRESVSPLVRDRIRLMETTKRRVRQRTALVCRRQVQQQQDIAPPPQRMLQRSWTELQFQPTHWPLGPKAASVDVVASQTHGLGPARAMRT